MFNSPQLQQFFIGLAIATSMGTLVQDTRINKALEVTVPLSDLAVNITSHLDGLNEAASSHSHVEQVSMVQDFTGIPRVQPRDDHRRYYVAKHSIRNKSLNDSSQYLWPNV